MASDKVNAFYEYRLYPTVIYLFYFKSSFSFLFVLLYLCIGESIYFYSITSLYKFLTPVTTYKFTL